MDSFITWDNLTLFCEIRQALSHVYYNKNSSIKGKWNKKAIKIDILICISMEHIIPPHEG